MMSYKWWDHPLITVKLNKSIVKLKIYAYLWNNEIVLHRQVHIGLPQVYNSDSYLIVMQAIFRVMTQNKITQNLGRAMFFISMRLKMEELNSIYKI